MNRDRKADLDKLADVVIGHFDYGDHYVGLDGKRPLGFSGEIGGDVLEAIGADPEGREGEYDVYTDDQIEYGNDLWGDVLGHIKDRWRELRRSDT